MDDSPVLEAANETVNVPAAEDDEIDPLDAYMLEIDKQVQALDSKDIDMPAKAEEEANAKHEEEEEEAAEDEDAKLKSGKFTSVEELIA
jgi:hypothetical protein